MNESFAISRMKYIWSNLLHILPLDVDVLGTFKTIKLK